MKGDAQTGMSGKKQPLDAKVFDDKTSVRKAKSSLKRVLKDVIRMAETESRIEAVRIRNLILADLAVIEPALSVNKGDGEMMPYDN
ncbi:MAG: hypothetical protein V1875_08445 [Candidatus Altiarchaeota archaeon]